jgi:hypothetical protein
MGYRRIYGFPGNGINGFFGVLQSANENRLHPGAARGDGRLYLALADRLSALYRNKIRIFFRGRAAKLNTAVTKGPWQS